MLESRNNLSDAEIIRAIGSGDREAFGMLVDRYIKDVHAAAARIVCNATAAEDITQDAFARAYQRLYLYDPAYSFRNWLLKIATNLSLNLLRSRQRERTLNIRMAEAAPPLTGRTPAGPDVPDPSEWQHWLDQIDETQRTAIVLFHFHEMPYTEIADVLEMPINTVRTLLHRGRRRLRELMAESPYGENRIWNAAK